ncbi:potassium channel family protein [Burkholderia sp. ABCPW 14]|uniref:potassium channel family protein n=1 Tax=Burkholderia sp. ABCPW 14 TaxID=1637860 RepID=UPI0018D25819|nr:potassium channel family protein [Burkholderia sp. ABCPW 14]
MKNDGVMQLMVAPAAEVRRDLRKNLPWVFGLLIVTVAYVSVSSASIRAFESGWTFLHACYFTVINMTTVGFGDVVPLTHGGKVIAGINAFAGLLLFGTLVAVLALALQPSGWSATLTSSESSNDSERTAPHRAGNDRTNAVENGVADFLEGLAKVIRAAEDRNEVGTREGRTRIRILADGNSPHFIEVYVDVRAS